MIIRMLWKVIFRPFQVYKADFKITEITSFFTFYFSYLSQPFSYFPRKWLFLDFHIYCLFIVFLRIGLPWQLALPLNECY